MQTNFSAYLRSFGLCALLALPLSSCVGCGSGGGTTGAATSGNGPTGATGGSTPPASVAPSSTAIQPGGAGTDASNSPTTPRTLPSFDISSLQSKHTIQGVTSLDHTHSYEWEDPSNANGIRHFNTFVFESDGRFLYQDSLFVFDTDYQQLQHETILRWYGSYRIANNVIELVWQSGDHQTLAFANTGSALVIGAKTFKTYGN